MSVVVKDQAMLEFSGLIEKESYDEAEVYIKSKELSDSILNFNLGYLEYKKGNLVDARAYLEKAKYKGMISNEVDNALMLVKTELDLVYSEQEFSKLDTFILESKSYSNDVFLSLGFILISFSVVLFIKKLKVFSILIMIMSVVVFGFVYSIKDYNIEYSLDDYTVYSGPSRIFEQVQILPKGSKVIFTKESSDWKFIKYPSIYSGWVYQSKAKRL